MRLKNLELNGFKSFSKKTVLDFENSIVAIVGPNGSGKSNIVEAIRFVLGEQSIKSMRGSSGADLIFKGSKVLPKSSRASVSIYFDNKDKIFKISSEGDESINLNYDAVSISREVYGDGMSKYMLNGSEVRLRDINNLLSSVNIGSSGHHIISQGEADRILSANLKEKKEIIEDALGLKIYQYKIREAERKLERTSNNMKEVSMLRRENAPHLNFLKKQVEKIEKAKELEKILLSLYTEYLKKEGFYLEKEEQKIAREKEEILSKIDQIKDKVFSEENDVEKRKPNPKEKELESLEKKMEEVRTLKSEVERKLGRVEGMVEMDESFKNSKPLAVTVEEIWAVFEEIDSSISEAEMKENIFEVKIILQNIKKVLDKFRDSSQGKDKTVDSKIEDLKKIQKETAQQIENLLVEENDVMKRMSELKSLIALENESYFIKERERQQEKFDLKVKYQELSSSMELVKMKEESLRKDIEAFQNEIKEGGVLVGKEVLSYKDYPLENTEEALDGFLRGELRKKIERIKIKLEDAGLGGGMEVLKEFEEVEGRDNFLAREMEDLLKSVSSLESLMKDLKGKLEAEFKEGVKKINVEFNNFFRLMFGGGEASISIISENKRKREKDEVDIEVSTSEEEIVFEQGIEINVSLPHKKVRDLNALSGGERSLTSIALLFAMSQVNPPPFLVLDETDAALDEANSRKYGDMLEKLSKKSQLIVVTHNRETMSRAGVLYGITVGADGSSKLLSVKLEEAGVFAK